MFTNKMMPSIVWVGRGMDGVTIIRILINGRVFEEALEGCKIKDIKELV